MKRLVELINLLAHQNRPLRGNREGSSSLNRGDFLELLNHQAQYDEVLLSHLAHDAKNAKYTDHRIQDELIHLSAEDIVSQIIR